MVVQVDDFWEPVEKATGAVYLENLDHDYISSLLSGIDRPTLYPL
jgi:hypothetical protein